ncbi:MAG: DUF4343 domain-containing protein [Myxococcales bacterium]|nr:MAG: DUF4343 domain-containing protein [Myxococcales bacterium]
MPTLLLSPRYTPDSIALWHAAIDAGWGVERLHGWRLPEGVAVDEPVFSDEPLLALMVAEGLGAHLLEPTLDWLTTLPARHLRRPVQFTTLERARSLPGPVFLKPADDKCFPARVYASGAELPALDALDPSTPTLASGPVSFEVEYRGFVADRKLHTMSPYVRGGDIARDAHGDWPAPPGEPDEARAYLDELLADPAVDVPAATVIDVGRIAGVGWAVVEANPAWGAGICGCDPHAVLPVLRRACRSAAELTADDRRWLVAR